MPDLNVRADAVNVEQIMDQIRARIREKRGVDYTEDQIRELAMVKLEKFLDPRAVRSDLIEQFRRLQREEGPLTFSFDEETLYESHRAPIIRTIRRMLQPVLKLFFNPNPLIRALHIQSQVNARQELEFEVMHNLVVELTRLGIEAKNLRMQVDSLTGRLEFNERRARALEGLLVDRPEVDVAPSPPPRPVSRPQPPFQPPPPAPASRPPAPQAESTSGERPPAPVEGGTPRPPEGPGQRSRRRRRRRGRRGPPAAVVMGGQGENPAGPATNAPDAVEEPGGDQNDDGGGADDSSDPEPQ